MLLFSCAVSIQNVGGRGSPQILSFVILNNFCLFTVFFTHSFAILIYKLASSPPLVFILPCLCKISPNFFPNYVTKIATLLLAILIINTFCFHFFISFLTCSIHVVLSILHLSHICCFKSSL